MGRPDFGMNIAAPSAHAPDPAFRWHEAARLFDGKGRETHPATQGSPLPDTTLSTRALAEAMASAAAGFRIGGDGPAPVRAGMPMFETLTAGSTGTPRRIRRSQASWTTSFAVNAGLFAIGPGTSVAVLGRLVHSLALYGAIEGLHLGAQVHLLDDLRPDRQARALATVGATHLYATPAQLRLMLDRTSIETALLRHVLVGGAKLDLALRARLSQFAPQARISEFYGAAETSFITLTDATTPDGSVGQPYPGVEIDLRGGEIWVQSPYVFDAYAADPGTARREGPWVSVGEMGHWHGASLVLAGRAGRMVTIADQNVFPEEIEAFLMGLPGITSAAVIARADRMRGAVLDAVVAGDPGAEAAILAACRVALGPLKSPRALIWRQDWPLTPSGKTDLAAIERGHA